MVTIIMIMVSHFVESTLLKMVTKILLVVNSSLRWNTVWHEPSKGYNARSEGKWAMLESEK